MTLSGGVGGIYEAGSGTLAAFIAELEGRGFEVTVNDGNTRVKGPTLKYRDEVDAALIVADIVGYFTTHLHDATMVKCLVNAYHNNPETIRATVDKLMGLSEFKGTPNELVRADTWQARL